MLPDARAAARFCDRLATAASERLDPADASDIGARAERLAPTLLELVQRLYGEARDVLADQLATDLVELAAARPEDLKDLDRRRAADPQWFQRATMTGYVAYTDRFAGTLRGMGEHLDHFEQLGVRYLHLMPLLAPREGESDGGYAVADYDAVDPRLGTMDDLTELARELHRRDVALCVDLVLNHTAREHEWAQGAMRGDEARRGFYFVFPDRREPDEYEQTVPDIFPELDPGSFTFVPEMDGWVWTTFRNFQWDLDYRNPAVLRAMIATMLTLANRGPDILRLDAVPFLWKRKGTNGQNLPEAHLVLQTMRCVLSIVAPGVLLKAEAMVAPEILTGYLGAHPDGDVAECDIAYDNQLMVMLWAMLGTGSSALARHALNCRPAAPVTTSWATYLRCHDDIGWAVSDADAQAVGLDGRAQRALLSATYAGGAQQWRSLGVPFQPEASGAAPISGTTAALAGLQAARAADDEAAIELAIGRIEALYSIVFSFGGIPLIYAGDEIGIGNDECWADDPRHHGDNRWLHRPPMDWAAVADARSDPSSVGGRLLDRIAGLARARATLSGLAAGLPVTVVDLGDDALFGYVRGGAVAAVVEIGGAPRTVDLNAVDVPGARVAHASAGVSFVDGVLALPAYGFAWLV